MATTIASIDSSKLGQLDFLSTDVLSTKRDKDRRRIKLMKSLELGTSLEQHESKIIFRCKSGIKKVEGAVIALSSSQVTFAGMTRLPVKSIIGLKLEELPQE